MTTTTVTEMRARVAPDRRRGIYAKCPKCGGMPVTRDANIAFAPWGCRKCSSKKPEERAVLYDYFIGDERLSYRTEGRYYSYVIPRVDELGTGENRIYGRWMPVRKGKRYLEVYMSCPICGGINDVTDNGIYANGSCECFYCAQCGIDLVISLGGWRRYRKFYRSKKGRKDVVIRGVWRSPSP